MDEGVVTLKGGLPALRCGDSGGHIPRQRWAHIPLPRDKAGGSKPLRFTVMGTTRQERRARRAERRNDRREVRQFRRAVISRYWLLILLAFVGLLLFTIAWPTMFLTHSVPAVIAPILAGMGTLPVILLYFKPPRYAWMIVAFASLLMVPFHTQHGFDLGWPVTFHLAMAVVYAAVLLKESSGTAAIIGAATVVLQLFNPHVGVGWAIGVVWFSVFFLLVRWLVASRKQLASSYSRLAQESARTSEENQLRVLAEERNRLARDLHDVVAHQMSMIVVQSQSAPYRLQGVTPAIHAEFDSLADTARTALDEVRGLLGVLRTDAETRPEAPVGADQIQPTLTAARSAGVDITWTIDGDLSAVDETAGVVLYRILQESLSNAARHAPGGTVLVTITVGNDTADMSIDNGPAVAGSLPHVEVGGGSGIKGMSARAQAAGGSFTALPAADGGFSVTASVPLRPRRGGRV